MPPQLLQRKHYKLVEDLYDKKISLHDEDAFQHGIHFKAKYIGSLDVPRPTGRMEIVVAMRKIRYEFKEKHIKKKKVTVTVSVNGVQIMLRKKSEQKIPILQKKDEVCNEQMLVTCDPVYRIFYVSHDSHDLKIWSYIARDAKSNNIFRCNVFKSSKKSHAMKMVRTIGQAFEVCHKFNTREIAYLSSVPHEKNKEPPDLKEHKTSEKTAYVKHPAESEHQKSSPGSVDFDDSLCIDQIGNGVADLDIHSSSALISSENATPPDNLTDIGLLNDSITLHHIHVLKQQIFQAEHRTKIAITEVKLLKDCLNAETTAHAEAKAQNHQLLQQNQQLMSQIQNLLTLFYKGNTFDVTDPTNQLLLKDSDRKKIFNFLDQARISSVNCTSIVSGKSGSVPVFTNSCSQIENTSIWTSSLTTPSELQSCFETVQHDNTPEVSTSFSALTQFSPQFNMYNDYSLSPICNSKHTSKSDETNLSSKELCTYSQDSALSTKRKYKEHVLLHTSSKTFQNTRYNQLLCDNKQIVQEMQTSNSEVSSRRMGDGNKSTFVQSGDVFPIEIASKSSSAGFEDNWKETLELMKYPSLGNLANADSRLSPNTSHDLLPLDGQSGQ